MSMQPLVIEYALDGKYPGYRFTTPTNGHSEAMLKDIWRSAMPRGQGWSQYVGAQSFKCFPVEDGRRIAFSEVIVTDQVDESGRRGIRRAEITILDAGSCLDALTLRLVMLPEAVRDAANGLLNFWRWKRILGRAMPKARQKHGQIILAYPYTGMQDWRVVEAVMLTVATSRRLRAFKGMPCAYPITTLALDHREESPLIALPLAQAQKVRDVPVIDLSF